MNKIIISEKFAMFTEEWTPKIIAESNGQLVKIAKGTGELILCVAYKTLKKRGRWDDKTPKFQAYKPIK